MRACPTGSISVFSIRISGPNNWVQLTTPLWFGKLQLRLGPALLLAAVGPAKATASSVTHPLDIKEEHGGRNRTPHCCFCEASFNSSAWDLAACSIGSVKAFLRFPKHCCPAPPLPGRKRRTPGARGRDVCTGSDELGRHSGGFAH